MAVFEALQTNKPHERVLFVAPTRRDAQLTIDLLERNGLIPFHCMGLSQLVQEASKGVGAILLTEEAIYQSGMNLLIERLSQQPDWSDVPVVLLAKSNSHIESEKAVQALTNVTLIEKPAPVVSLISAIRTAVRSRERQYQIRDKVQEVAQAAEQFELMANSIPQLAWMARPNGDVFWINRQWVEYTGSKSQDMMGWGWTNAISPTCRDESIEVWSQALRSGRDFYFECPLRAADGSFRSFLGLGAAIRGKGGKVVRWLATFTDVEEQNRIRSARESLLESERRARSEAERAARLKDEFIATLSHELRTPLSSIIGWSFLLKKSPDNPSIVSDASEVISRSGEILKALVDDLLDLSRISSGKLRLEFKNVDLATLATSSVEASRPAAEAKSIHLTTEFPAFGSEVRGDPARLQQVITNLLSNAIRFTPDKGRITLSMEMRPATAVLNVKDSGQGIDPSFLPHLFDRFRQADSSSARKHGGMGIGLSLVKQFVELHGGQVAVVSEGVGKGSTFSIEIPLASSFGESATEMSPEERELAGLHILIVDDDQAIRELLHRILSEAGAITKVAGSVDEAMASIGTQIPDVLVSDIGMPGKDGYDLIKELRSSGFDRPAIAITAFVQPQDRERAIQAGFQRHIPKPIQPVKLIDAVRSLVGFG